MIRLILIILYIFLCAGCIDEPAEVPKNFPAFTTNDLYGNIVTNSIFTEKTITIVNLWTTDSPPCQALLNNLSDLNNEFDDLQVVGLVADTKNIEAAKKIVADKINFSNLIVNDDFKDLLVTVTSVPTTFFVDSNGQIIGQSVAGDDITLIRRELIRLLDINSPRTRDLNIIQKNIFY